MSNRTLIEINHDMAGMIARNPEKFVVLLTRQLNGSLDNYATDVLRNRYGVRVFGRRHHSEYFKIEWGAHKAEETRG